MGDMKVMSIHISEAEHRQFKTACAKKGKSMKEIVLLQIRRVIQEEREK